MLRTTPIVKAATALIGLCIIAMLPVGCSNSVESEPVTPKFVSEAPLEAVVGQQYTYDVRAEGDPRPTYRLDQAPAGMTIDTADGMISWVPTAENRFDSKVVVVAANSSGSVSQESIVQVTGLQIEGWETSSLVTEGIDPVVIRAIAADIEAGTYPQINSFLIIRNGKLAYEGYFNNAVRNTAKNIYSAEKSITSCLVGIALDNGLIAGVNEPLYPFFPEYDAFDNWSTRKETISLKHLVTMTSGFELEGQDYEAWLNNIGPRDWIKFYLDLPVVAYPGYAFNYLSLCDRLAGYVVERQAGTTLPEFAAEHLFRPLGMANYNWDGWNPVDNSMISSQLRLRAIDMAKIGQMYLDRGLWKGYRIVAENWVIQSIAPTPSHYGYNWWIHKWTTPVGGIDVYYAFGNGGNSIYVFEALQMVVVFTGDYFVRPDLWEQQYDLLKTRIIPVVGSGS